jgi:glycolate oxidase iron-sulfur subunit
MTQIGAGTNLPIVHTIELLSWAYGGPRPDALRGVTVSNEGLLAAK